MEPGQALRGHEGAAQSFSRTPSKISPGAMETAIVGHCPSVPSSHFLICHMSCVKEIGFRDSSKTLHLGPWSATVA